MSKREHFDQDARDRILSLIPQEAILQAKEEGYEYKVIRLKGMKTERKRQTLTASRYFVEPGTTMFYKRDHGIEVIVKDDRHVEMEMSDGKRKVLTFASAQKECDEQARGVGVGGLYNPAWQTLFEVEGPDGACETLARRRERIIEEKLSSGNA